MKNKVGSIFIDDSDLIDYLDIPEQQVFLTEVTESDLEVKHYDSVQTL
jgi:hypothetical protein